MLEYETVPSKNRITIGGKVINASEKNAWLVAQLVLNHCPNPASSVFFPFSGTSAGAALITCKFFISQY